MFGVVFILMALTIIFGLIYSTIDFVEIVGFIKNATVFKKYMI